MLNTSEPAELDAQSLIGSLRRQPLLVVLRAYQPLELHPTLVRLQSHGVRHVELAWSDHPDWSVQCRSLVHQFPSICFGAASLRSEAALHGVATAGLSFAVSPVLDPRLLALARSLELTLVPGVMTPSEVHQACELGCVMVKLFPAATLGPDYWRRLAGPLGPLPFCIAAGGLGPADLSQWLAAGADAVAIGASLGVDDTDQEAWRQLAYWLQMQSG